LIAGFAAALLVLLSACVGEDFVGTPTLRPARTAIATSTPNLDVLAKTRVADIFAIQIAAIQRKDWAALYPICSPQFRAARDLDRFVRDSSAQFARDGYSASGFEARNVEPFVRAPYRVRVRWDAYQGGEYIRTEEVGQTYVFTQGDWFDDGAWCR
jgi:hypothetical protein